MSVDFYNPWEAFHQWYFEAQQQLQTNNKDAVILATSAINHQPSCRVVLLKSFSVEQGFIFYTNYQSRKGQELEQNPLAALLFFWDSMGRQIRIEGEVQKVSAALSDEYFQSRPKASQISACVSQQSEPIESYEILKDQCTTVEQTLEGKEVPRPEHWGGYALTPQRFEFWQDRRSRRHERICFDDQSVQYPANPNMKKGSWKKSYLSP